MCAYPNNSTPSTNDSNGGDESRDSTRSARSTPSIILAARFLFPFADRSTNDGPAWRTAARWFILWGIIIGAAYAIAFRGSWRWFGEYNRLRLVPMAVILTLDLGWCGYRLLGGATRLASHSLANQHSQPPPLSLQAVLLVILVTLLKYALLLSLPFGARLTDGDVQWREYLGIFYPWAIFRPLILMPIWGRWAVTLALLIGRAAPSASPRLRHMASGISLRFTMLTWLGCSGLTVLYCSGAGENLAEAVFISVGVMLIAYLVSFALAWRAGGQTEATIAAAGLAAEIAFLMFYLPVGRSIYRY